MNDFTWSLTLLGVTYVITMNECTDDSPWVGEVHRDGVLIPCFSEVAEAVQEAFGMSEEEADNWLDDALQARLDFQREELKK